MTAPKFSVKDRVVHATRPEWGVGEVTGAESVMQNGKASQRLTVRFERAGLKTLSTAHAELKPADSHPLGGAGSGWLGSLEQRDPRDLMARLPDAATDPFHPLESRLRATLDLYRFTGAGASLFDWAAAQTGMSDPLARFNRQELEQFFRSFEIERDAHLKRIVGDARRVDPEMLARVVKEAPPAAQGALRRADAGR